MHLLKEMQDQGYDVEDLLAINCKLFENNSGVLEQAKTAKSQPRTLDISAPWHLFCSEVENELIQIHDIQTAWQYGNMFAKQVSKKDFADPDSGGKISPSKMKKCEDTGF
jgi:hypothetical protein